MSEETTKPKVESAEGLDVEVRSPSKLAETLKRRWYVAAFGGLVLTSIIGGMLSDGDRKRVIKKEDPVVQTTPKNINQKTWQSQSQAEISELRDSVKMLVSENKSLNEKIKSLTAQNSEQTKKIRDIEMEQVKRFKELGRKVPPPPKPGTGSEIRPQDPDISRSERLRPPPIPGKTPGTVKTAPKVVDDKPIIMAAAPTGKHTEEVKAEVRYKKNKFAGFLPPNSFASVAMMTGLDAGASESTRENPEPVMMRIQKDAMLPGSAKYKLKGCFVLGSAHGNLSSERVEIRLARMSCVDKNNKLVLASPIKGYVIDSDGTLGLRGKVVRRNGALLAKSLLAGFAQGLSSAFGTAASGIPVGGDDGTVMDAGTALSTAGLSGANQAMNKLAEFYLKEAQNIFPVITISAGRKGTVVITEGVSLKWNDYGSIYVKETTPKNK